MIKKSLFGYVIPLVIFIATFILCYYGLDHDPRAIPSPLINKPVPDFNLFVLDNTKQLNNKIFLGKISLFNIWATWCASCKEEHKILMDIAKTKQVVIYGLNYKDESKIASKWLLKNGNPYREVLFDEQGKLGVDLGVYGTPETYLIDQQGIIRYKYIGPVTQDVWMNILLPEIKKIKK